MRWATLSVVYGGTIGNSLFLLSVIAIVSSVPLLDIRSVSLSVSLLGAMVLSISYIVQKIAIPDFISRHPDYFSYYEHLLKLKNDKTLSSSHEFNMLENNGHVQSLKVFSDNQFCLAPFVSRREYDTVLGEGAALYSLCIIKHSYVDHLYRPTRVALSSSFALGIVLFYIPAATRIVEVVTGGLS